jgi:DNA-binding response OmpR family regulator
MEFRPDVVLLDLLSPRSDGFEICRRIRSDYSTRHVRVIAMSDAREQEHRQRILMAGAEAYFSKPLNNQQLLETIGLCLEQTAAQQSLQF